MFPHALSEIQIRIEIADTNRNNKINPVQSCTLRRALQKALITSLRWNPA